MTLHFDYWFCVPRTSGIYLFRDIDCHTVNTIFCFFSEKSCDQPVRLWADVLQEICQVEMHPIRYITLLEENVYRLSWCRILRLLRRFMQSSNVSCTASLFGWFSSLNLYFLENSFISSLTESIRRCSCTVERNTISEFLINHGASDICFKMLFCALCIMEMFESQAQPHNCKP